MPLCCFEIATDRREKTFESHYMRDPHLAPFWWKIKDLQWNIVSDCVCVMWVISWAGNPLQTWSSRRILPLGLHHRFVLLPPDVPSGTRCLHTDVCTELGCSRPHTVGPPRPYHHLLSRGLNPSPSWGQRALRSQTSMKYNCECSCGEIWT